MDISTEHISMRYATSAPTSAVPAADDTQTAVWRRQTLPARGLLQGSSRWNARHRAWWGQAAATTRATPKSA
jgi:hypothetical protein